MGYSACGHKESDMHAHTHSRIKIWPLTSKTMKWHVSYKGILSFV